MSKVLDPCETLDAFRQATVVKLPYQRIRINRNSKHFINEVFKLFKKGTDVKKAPDVEFEGEEGMDASGLTREYLYLLLSKIRGGDGTTVLFEGQPAHLSPLYDIDCLDSGFYFFVGQALAQSFLHGGYPLSTTLLQMTWMKVYLSCQSGVVLEKVSGRSMCTVNSMA